METLHITNTLNRKKEKFEPLVEGHVGLYVCGPTVYSTAHLGNVRTFLSFDIVYRYLKHLGYKVRYVRNITDVGHITNSAGDDVDSIGNQAKLENLEPMEIVQKYTISFHDTMKIFNLEAPSIEPTATGHIVEQIEMVQRIIDNGYAYEKNGSVYFDVPKFAKEHSYGKLSGRNIDEQQDGYRELDAQDEKNDPRDFAIWKGVDETFPMRWNSPWGEGVPGWHLECSVMSTKYLGQKFDIHGGGMDLKFPHHDCEIAQSIGADGTEPVRYWMHTNMLTMNGQKMSKSLGNSVLPLELISGNHELLEQGYSPMTIRFFMLQSHYASQLDLSNDALQAAEKGYKRLANAFDLLDKVEHNGKENISDEEEKAVLKLIQDCSVYMNDDFNTAQTLAVLFEMSNKINAIYNKQFDISLLSKATFDKMKATFAAFFTNVLGLKSEKSEGSNGVTDGLMDLILEIRKSARENKDWTISDKIRDELKALNIVVKDEKDGGTTWTVG